METIEVSTQGFASAIRVAMEEARVDERRRIAQEVEDMITESMPGGLIIQLRVVRDRILDKLPKLVEQDLE